MAICTIRKLNYQRAKGLLPSIILYLRYNRSKAFSRLHLTAQCVAYARLSEEVSNTNIVASKKEIIKEQTDGNRTFRKFLAFKKS